jgi:hypothetical protein
VLGGANPFNTSDPTGASDPLSQSRPCPSVIAVEENHGNDPALNGTATYANAFGPYSAGKFVYQATNSANPTLDIRNGFRPIAIYMDGTGADRSTATYPVSWTGSAFALNSSVVNESNVTVGAGHFPGVRYLYNVVDNTSPSTSYAASLGIIGFQGGTTNSPLCTPFPAAGNKRSTIRSNGFLELPSASQSASANAPTTGTNSATSCRLNPVTPPPTVTINQGASQLDPVSFGAGPLSVSFDVVFSQSVTGFDLSDVTLGGTSVGTRSVTVTPIDGSHYTVTVTYTALTTPGTLIATIGSNKAVNVFGAGNLASTTLDNTVQINA